MVQTEILVGLGEIQVIKGHVSIKVVGIAANVGLVALDRKAGVAGGANFILPRGEAIKMHARPGQFVETGVAFLISKMIDLGANFGDIQVAFVGGAQVIDLGNSKLAIGARNVEKLRQALTEARLSAPVQEVGGSFGRDISLNSQTGAVYSSSVLAGNKQLGTLGGA